ncbi:hypothetical protein GIB67_027980, partial [Kingdonia uniflora]
SPARNLKKTQNPRFIKKKFSNSFAFNIHYLFIDFPLGHLQNTYHEIIHQFGSNPLQNELRNKQTEPFSLE